MNNNQKTEKEYSQVCRCIDGQLIMYNWKAEK